MNIELPGRAIARSATFVTAIASSCRRRNGRLICALSAMARADRGLRSARLMPASPYRYGLAILMKRRHKARRA